MLKILQFPPVLEHLSICDAFYKKNAFYPLFLPLCFPKYFPVEVLKGLPRSERTKDYIACDLDMFFVNNR
jgi:hypothetical protein